MNQNNRYLTISVTIPNVQLYRF